MHQVRYFLAVARLLNFTRAAEECNVAQPSLTRAIKQLEEEFGHDLFRRERNLTHLTEFGRRMTPFLQQCYDCAAAAKTLATSLKKGGVPPLSLAISRSVSLSLIVSHLAELSWAFDGLELRLLRGASGAVAEHLKKGEAELPLRVRWASPGSGWRPGRCLPSASISPLARPIDLRGTTQSSQRI
ncbi:MAG: LysR family transcriptional regulator [Methylocella sp.]